MTSPRTGLAKIEVIACLVACAVLLSITAVLTANNNAGDDTAPAKSLKDAKQLEHIHKTMLIFARDWNGTFSSPGLINRLADPELDREVPGRGPEDFSANTTANLFSCMIAQNYITSEILISPVERNPSVKPVKPKGYDYDKYDPVQDSYWDRNFKADLTTESNVSYAHPPLTDPWVIQWRDGMLANYAQLGNRGPKDGARDPGSYTCGPHGFWAGNVVFGDNSVKMLTKTRPDELNGDNLFAADKDRDLDSLLAFTKKVVDKKATLQFD